MLVLGTLKYQLEILQKSVLKMYHSLKLYEMLILKLLGTRVHRTRGYKVSKNKKDGCCIFVLVVVVWTL